MYMPLCSCTHKCSSVGKGMNILLEQTYKLTISKGGAGRGERALISLFGHDPKWFALAAC